MCLTVCDGSCAARTSTSSTTGTSASMTIGFLIADVVTFTVRRVVGPLVKYVVWPLAIAVFVLAARAGVAVTGQVRAATVRRRARRRAVLRVTAWVATRPEVTDGGGVTLTELAGHQPAALTRGPAPEQFPAARERERVPARGRQDWSPPRPRRGEQ